MGHLLKYGALVNQQSSQGYTPLDQLFIHYKIGDSSKQFDYEQILLTLMSHHATDCKDEHASQILSLCQAVLAKQPELLTNQVRKGLLTFAICNDLLRINNLPLLIDPTTTYLNLSPPPHSKLAIYKLQPEFVHALLKHTPQLKVVNLIGCYQLKKTYLEQFAAIGIEQIHLSYSQAKGCGLIDLNSLDQFNKLKINQMAIHITHFEDDEILLSRRGLTDEQITMLSSVLKDNKTLLQLDLAKAGLNAARLRLLLNSLEHHPELHTLLLEKNYLGDEGAHYLALWLQARPQLKKLALENNKITGAGIEFLAEALRDNKHLQSLSLFNNPMGDRGLIALSSMLEKNPCLEQLDINQTQISSEGACQLTQALISNRALTSLNIRYNALDDSFARALLSALRLNKSLTDLRIEGDSKISSSLLVQVAHIIKQHAEQQIELRLLQQYRTFSKLSNFDLIQPTKSKHQTNQSLFFEQAKSEEKNGFVEKHIEYVSQIQPNPL